MPSVEPQRVLVVEDDPVIRKLMVTIAREAGFLTSEATNGAVVLDMLEENDYGLIILDLMLPRLSGYELLDRLSRRDEVHTIILVTAASDHDLATIDSPEVVEIIRKPFDIDDLRRAIVTAFEWKSPEEKREATARLRLKETPLQDERPSVLPPDSPIRRAARDTDAPPPADPKKKADPDD